MRTSLLDLSVFRVIMFVVTTLAFYGSRCKMPLRFSNLTPLQTHLLNYANAYIVLLITSAKYVMFCLRLLVSSESRSLGRL